MEWKPLVASAMISRYDLSTGNEGEYFRRISTVVAVSIFVFPFLTLSVISLLRTPGFVASSLILALAFDLVLVVGVVLVAWSFWQKSKALVLLADRKVSDILGREGLLAVLRRIQSSQSEFPPKEKQPSVLRILLLFPSFQQVPRIQDRIAALENQ